MPKEEHEAPEWQAAMEALLLVAEHNGPTMFARIGVIERCRIKSGAERNALGKTEAKEEPMKTVWIYVDASKEVGDVDHVKVFVDEITADTWLAENDPEGVAFEYDVIE